MDFEKFNWVISSASTRPVQARSWSPGPAALRSNGRSLFPWRKLDPMSRASSILDTRKPELAVETSTKVIVYRLYYPPGSFKWATQWLPFHHCMQSVYLQRLRVWSGVPKKRSCRTTTGEGTMLADAKTDPFIHFLYTRCGFWMNICTLLWSFLGQTSVLSLNRIRMTISRVYHIRYLPAGNASCVSNLATLHSRRPLKEVFNIGRGLSLI